MPAECPTAEPALTLDLDGTPDLSPQAMQAPAQMRAPARMQAQAAVMQDQPPTLAPEVTLAERKLTALSAPTHLDVDGEQMAASLRALPLTG